MSRTHTSDERKAIDNARRALAGARLNAFDLVPPQLLVVLKKQLTEQPRVVGVDGRSMEILTEVLEAALSRAGNVELPKVLRDALKSGSEDRSHMDKMESMGSFIGDIIRTSISMGELTDVERMLILLLQIVVEKREVLSS